MQKHVFLIFGRNYEEIFEILKSVNRSLELINICKKNLESIWTPFMTLEG